MLLFLSLLVLNLTSLKFFAAAAPIAAKPTKKPVMGKPVIRKPTKKPVTGKPVIPKPTKKPVAGKPVIPKPTKKPAPSKPNPSNDVKATIKVDNVFGIENIEAPSTEEDAANIAKVVQPTIEKVLGPKWSVKVLKVGAFSVSAGRRLQDSNSTEVGYTASTNLTCAPATCANAAKEATEQAQNTFTAASSNGTLASYIQTEAQNQNNTALSNVTVGSQSTKSCGTIVTVNGVAITTASPTTSLGQCLPISPTWSPTAQPTASPTAKPTNPTASPTASPSAKPTAAPTTSPTASPTSNPTESPTASPTSNPTESPTASPTANPTESPTASPTAKPTNPTAGPTAHPTASPSSKPTAMPTVLAFAECMTSSPGTQGNCPNTYLCDGQSCVADTTGVCSCMKKCNNVNGCPSTTEYDCINIHGGNTNKVCEKLPTASPTAKPTNPTAKPTSKPTLKPTASAYATCMTSSPGTQGNCPNTYLCDGQTCDIGVCSCMKQCNNVNACPSTTEYACVARFGGTSNKVCEKLPTAKPTLKPSSKPTRTPSAKPSAKPSRNPSTKPTAKRTSKPTAKPTASRACTTTSMAAPLIQGTCSSGQKCGGSTCVASTSGVCSCFTTCTNDGSCTTAGLTGWSCVTHGSGSSQYKFCQKLCATSSDCLSPTVCSSGTCY